MAFSKVVPLHELCDGEMQGHVVSGRKVLLVKLDGRVFAYEDRCAHLGVALSEGRFQDGVIECKAHQYRYDAQTGCGINPKNVRLCVLAVTIEDGVIAVDPGEAS